jgi:alpha-glucosidase
MRDVAIPFNEIKDPQGLNMPDKNLSRDPSRTPMQWDNTKNAGFSEGTPWLRLDKTYARMNVREQRNNPHSTLNLYKKLITIRKTEPALETGNYISVYSDNQMIAYIRKDENGPGFFIVLNLSHRPCYFKSDFNGVIEIATSPELEGNTVSGTISLNGDEGLLIRLKQPGT